MTYEQAGTLRDTLAAGVALEAFHRQADVLSMANLAQIVNVLHAPVQTEGEAMWVTPTFYTFQLHVPHIGATALQVETEKSNSLPDGSAAVTATASRKNTSIQVTIINRHLYDSASVSISCGDAPNKVRGEILAAASPQAVNSANAPDHVKPVALKVTSESDGKWRIDLPPHALTTLVFGG